MNNATFDIVTVGERGQIVIPAGLRRDFNVTPGDKLVIFACPKNKGIGIVPMAELPEMMAFLEKRLNALGTVTQQGKNDRTKKQ